MRSGLVEAYLRLLGGRVVAWTACVAVRFGSLSCYSETVKTTRKVEKLDAKSLYK